MLESTVPMVCASLVAVHPQMKCSSVLRALMENLNLIREILMMFVMSAGPALLDPPEQAAVLRAKAHAQAGKHRLCLQ